MSLEILDDRVVLEPGPLDVHAHPRLFDHITEDGFVELNEGKEGRAGIRAYSETAIESGITGILGMPNEMMRLLDLSVPLPERTGLESYPISNRDKLLAALSKISEGSVIPAGQHYGLDPSEIVRQDGSLDRDKLYQRFSEAEEDATALKIYGGETYGGFNVRVEDIPEIATIWNEVHPTKPIIMHLEDENVGRVLSAVNRLTIGRELPIHIAHVSSRQELEAVIAAKEDDMNVTCEVTPHHLFINDEDSAQIGGYGCVKPGIKNQEDIDFLWANMEYIDIFASDCAPHRRSDKEADNPSPGMTNHSVMLRLLFGAVADGKLTYDQLYEKFCINPRKRFNLPLEDGSLTVVNTEIELPTFADNYGFNPFNKLNRKFHLVGTIQEVRAGGSRFERDSNGIDFRSYDTSYLHLIRPKNLAA